jgi:hypothetical protein
LYLNRVRHAITLQPGVSGDNDFVEQEHVQFGHTTQAPVVRDERHRAVFEAGRTLTRIGGA